MALCRPVYLTNATRDVKHKVTDHPEIITKYNSVEKLIKGSKNKNMTMNGRIVTR
jgi:hypothetical protein